MDPSAQMEMGNPQTQRTATTDPQTNILQNLERANQSILELGNMVQQQQMQLAQLQQQANVAQHQRGISVATAEVDESRQVVQPQPSLIDTRTLGKPETFKGDANEFSDWQFVFKSYMSCVNPLFAELLERVESSKVPVPNRFLSQGERALSTQLYYVLVMLLRNRALDIAYNAGVAEGLEAYRRLHQQYHPKVASRYVGSLSAILATRFGSDIEAELESFDKVVRRYEMESGKTIDDEMLLGIVIHGLQDQATRDHLIMNASRLTTYDTVRTELLEMARTNRVLQQMPVPMDISAAPFKGKGKGKKGDTKGKDPKGKGKSENKGGKGKNTKGKNSSTENPHKDKECRYCHKMGHIKSECRKRIADEKNAQGSGKNRPHSGAPHAEEEPEPMGASPELIAGCVGLEKDILIDSGAGSHLFEKGFDEHAINVGSARVGMVTVTGEPLSTGILKRSIINTDAGKFSIDYAESDKVQFSVLSAGKAAERGTWTVIGPGQQCMILGKNANKIKKALVETEKIRLVKKRGVYWLPAKPCQSAGSPAKGAGGTAPLAAVRPAAKTVPAEAYREEPQEEQGARVEPPSGVRAAPPHEGEDEDIFAEEAHVVELPAVGEPPSEVSPDSRKPKSKKIPDNVSQEEYNTHMLTHLPLRSWCDHCMKGKIREDGHFKRNPGSNPSEVPRVSMDYCYLGRVLKPVGRDNPIEDKIEDLRTAQDEDEGTVPVLVITDEKTGCVFAGAVAKGVNAYALHLVTEALKFTGRQKVILLADAEHSIRALAEAAAKEWGKECQLQVAPRESHASNGAAERAILELARQARTLVSGLEHHFPEFKMLPTHKTYSWIIRHAAWLLTRYLVKLDGRTPYERLRGREYRGEIAEGFETVHYKVASTQKGKLDPQSAIGVWLGKSLMSDEHLIGTDQGIRRCRSIWRRPENKRWEKKTFEGFKGLPWQPRGELTVVPGTPSLPAPGTPGGGRRGVYITLALQEKHGQTPGCPGCFTTHDQPKPHSKECRQRFEEIVGKERQQSAGGPAAADRSAGGPATSEPAGGPAVQPDLDIGLDVEIGDPSSESGTKRHGGEQQPEAVPKRTKQESKRGEKREATTETDDLRASDLHAAMLLETPECMSGETTLHTVPLAAVWEESVVAGYPDWAHYEGAVDERTGESLPEDKVKRARGRELEKMDEHNVKKDISWSEARELGLKIVKSRWVDGWKPLPDDPNGVRSRCVAMEINTGPRDDVFSGTPPLMGHRLIVSLAATRRKGQKFPHRLLARYDVSVAFFHAKSSGRIAVIPPKDLYTGDTLWFLNKAMNGTREASKRWGERVKTTMVQEGFHAVETVPGIYRHAEWDVTVSCHGDDFLAEGCNDGLDRLDEVMTKGFEVKILPRIGAQESGGAVREGRHLHRLIKWTTDGFTWQADPKYAQQLVADMGLTGTKGVDSPASKETGKGNRDLDKPLSDSDAKEFRRLAGTALYLSLDCPTIQFAMTGIAAGMAKPTVLHQLRLKRLGRYLVRYPVEEWIFETQDQPGELQVYTDSDWAACVETRKSMSSYSIKYGKHLLDTSCAKQSIVALSSGEAEFYAITRGSAAGMMVQNILQEIGCKTKLVCLTDSSAAKGICHRRGVGRVKHLALKELWVQDRVDKGELTVKKVGTDENWGDLGTKALDGWRITQLIGMMPMKRGLVVASLVASAMAQGPEEQRPVDSIMFVLYMFVLHILALVGFWSIMSNGRRRFRSVESQTYLHTGEQEIQVEYTTETKEIQTTEEQRSEPSAGSAAKAAGAPNKINTVSTAQAASAPSSSSSVVTTSTPASVVPFLMV